MNKIKTKLKFREIKTRLENVLAENEDWLCELALKIHQEPEISFNEYKTSDLLVCQLLNNGFKVKTRLAGLPTAFLGISRKDKSHPAIGFLAEMDALSGLGHACGHNLIAVSSLGASIVLRKAFPSLKGSIELIGCPAEERGGGKVIMNNAGVFDHLDFAMLIHPSNRTEIYKLSLALVEIELVFIGKSSHASAAPEKGINALDALVQTFNSVNSLRSRLSGHSRINGIITDGGKAPNIIPDRARAEFWVRDESLDRALEYAEMVANSARASALAIGAKARVKIRQELAYAPFVPNRTAGAVLWEIYERIGIKLEQGDEKAEMGSTDLGNLSWRVPALHPTIAITPGREVAPHSVEFARASASKQGLEAMKKAILAMALMGYRVMTDSNLRKKMKAELREKRKLK